MHFGIAKLLQPVVCSPATKQTVEDLDDDLVVKLFSVDVNCELFILAVFRSSQRPGDKAKFDAL
jgi:hypothetical protein